MVVITALTTSYAIVACSDGPAAPRQELQASTQLDVAQNAVLSPNVQSAGCIYVEYVGMSLCCDPALLARASARGTIGASDAWSAPLSELRVFGASNGCTWSPGPPGSPPPPEGWTPQFPPDNPPAPEPPPPSPDPYIPPYVPPAPQPPGGSNPEGNGGGDGGPPSGGGGGETPCTQVRAGASIIPSIPGLSSTVGGDCGSVPPPVRAPRCPGDKPNCIKDLTAAQRQLIERVMAKFKTSGMPQICMGAAALIRRAFSGSGAYMYAGDGTIHDDPADPHGMQAYPDIRNGTLIEFSLHIDEDYLQDVSNGVRSLSDAANLLLHEGMHGIINPATSNGYRHPGQTGEPYSAPFSDVHTGSFKCVR
jgi:hypothetical protein